MDKDLYSASNIKKMQEDIDALVENFFGSKVDEKTLLILNKYLNINPSNEVDVKSLFQSIKRDNKINDILGDDK